MFLPLFSGNFYFIWTAANASHTAVNNTTFDATGCGCDWMAIKSSLARLASTRSDATCTNTRCSTLTCALSLQTPKQTPLRRQTAVFEVPPWCWCRLHPLPPPINLGTHFYLGPYRIIAANQISPPSKQRKNSIFLKLAETRPADNVGVWTKKPRKRLGPFLLLLPYFSLISDYA